jgi:glycosyltransferase domain-containing protein
MISILIPTLDRPEFLYRALKYYQAAGFDGTLFIGDSSNQENSSKNLRYIDTVSSRLNVDYRYYEKDKFDIGLVVKDQIERVKTPYIAVCCDDDFLNVQGVNQCVAFLDDNPAYASARGIRLDFYLSQIDSVYGDIAKLNYLPSLQLEDDRAAARWATYMNCNTSTGYNVHRKEMFQKMWEYVERFTTYSLRHEIFQCSVTCLTGKTKNLNVLYNVVQQHHGSISYSGKITVYDAIMNEGWSADVKAFSDYVCGELIKSDKMQEEDARRFFYREFERYLAGHFLYQTEIEHKNIDIDRITNIAVRLRAFIRKNQLLSAFLRRLLNRRADATHLYNNPNLREVSLSSLLSPSSPYRIDFLKIAAIIAEKRLS